MKLRKHKSPNFEHQQATVERVWRSIGGVGSAIDTAHSDMREVGFCKPTNRSPKRHARLCHSLFVIRHAH